MASGWPRCCGSSGPNGANPTYCLEARRCGEGCCAWAFPATDRAFVATAHAGSFLDGHQQEFRGHEKIIAVGRGRERFGQGTLLGR